MLSLSIDGLIKQRASKLKTLFFVILIVLLFPAIIAANEIKNGDYTVKKCDTLWEIAEEKLNNPFLWRDLWKANPHIRDPHLIFPGQKLNIPDIIAEQEREEIVEGKDIVAIPEKTIPLPTIIPKITPRKIPIQKKDYLVSKETLLQSGYISDDANSVGKILGSLDGKTLMGDGDYVYIMDTNNRPANLGDQFYVIKRHEKVYHPATGNFIGYLVKVKGILEIIGEDNGYKRALILESYKEITSNDLLLDFYTIEPPLEPDKERRPAINGTIVRLWDKHNISGIRDMVYLDKGTTNDVEVGDIFNIITDKKPPVVIGTIKVISTKDKTSVAMINKAIREVKNGNLFGN